MTDKSSIVDVARVEPVRAVTTSEIEHPSGTADIGSSITKDQSVTSTEAAKTSSGYGWGSLGSFGSGLVKAAASVISETPSLVTGTPFAGTPAAPVPTVPNLGSAVIGYEQKSDSQQYEQTDSQQQQELRKDSQTQELVYQGCQLPPNFSMELITKPQNEVYQGPQVPPNFSFGTPDRTADMLYGPELPPYLTTESSSAVLQRTESESLSSQLSYQQTSSDHSVQQTTKPKFSEVEYGPKLPPNLTTENQSSQSSKAQSIYEQMSSDYIRSKESSDIEYGPALPPAWSQGAQDSSEFRSGASYQRSESDHSRQESSQVTSRAQTSQENVHDSTGEFRFPGAFDDEEVAPDVVLPQIPRSEKTSSSMYSAL